MGTPSRSTVPTISPSRSRSQFIWVVAMKNSECSHAGLKSQCNCGMRDGLIKGQTFPANCDRIDLQAAGSRPAVSRSAQIRFEQMDRLGHAVEPVVEVVAAECTLKASDQGIVGQVSRRGAAGRGLPPPSKKHAVTTKARRRRPTARPFISSAVNQLTRNRRPRVSRARGITNRKCRIPVNAGP